jgi:plastocyanin
MSANRTTSRVRTFTAAVAVWLAVTAAAEAGAITGSIAVSGAAEAERTVVYIEAAPEVPGAARRAKLSQKGTRFSPAVLPVVHGTNVDMTNNDWIAHSVFSKSEAKPFDLGIYSPGTVKTVEFAQEGVVDVFCSIHPMMNSVVLVLQNPFFAKPDAQGQFAIQDIPAGTYTLKVYRLGGTPAAQQVAVPASGSVSTSF